MVHEAIDYLNCAVMAQAKPLRKRPDGGKSSFRQSFNGEQDLVLLRFDALRPSGFFAQVQELADAIAELGKLAILGSRNLSAVCSRENTLAARNH
jgi:hypothetical protein